MLERISRRLRSESRMERVQMAPKEISVRRKSVSILRLVRTRS
jgi:hypothetical protein